MKHLCKNYVKERCPVVCTATSCEQFDPTAELWAWFIEHCDNQGECGESYLEDYEPQQDESRE